MDAFISYSHQDSGMLTLLHKHLVQLQRDEIISAWTDRDIMPGGKLDQTISSVLSKAGLFIALLSPDYIASNYCYEKEFQSALGMQNRGMIIVPIIVEPCDWLNTPFKDFKALPTDGKAVSTWENKNTAFLDIVQNIRKLIVSSNTNKNSSTTSNAQSSIPRNYRIQKDFDTIEKIEFVEKTLHEVKEYLKRYIDEIIKLENIKARILIDNTKEFECILVNRNKIATESHLTVAISTENSSIFSSRANEMKITYSIITGSNMRQEPTDLILSFDDYHLFWSINRYFSGSQDKKELDSKEISELIWSKWLESVGIL